MCISNICLLNIVLLIVFLVEYNEKHRAIHQDTRILVPDLLFTSSVTLAKLMTLDFFGVLHVPDEEDEVCPFSIEVL